MAIHDFEPFIRRRQSLEVLKVGCIAMRHLNSNNEDFSFFTVLVILPFQKSFANSKEAVCCSFMMGEYFHA